MSNERFDKHIRKKLESLQPPYHKEAWQTFRQLLPAPWYVLFLRRYGSWLYSGAATVALCTFMYLYFQKQAENKQLQEKIAALQTITQPSNSPAPSLISAQNSKIGKDSAALPVAKSLPADSNVNTYTQEIRYARERLAAVEGIVIGEKKRFNNIIPSGDLQTDKVPDHQPATTTTPQPKQDSARVTYVQNSPFARSSQEENKRPETSITDTSSAPVLNGNSHQEAPLQQKDSLQSAVPKDSLEASGSNPSEESNPDSSIRTTLHSRLGISGYLEGNKNVAFGPTAEVFLSKRFSLEAGLHFSKPAKERYSSISDYNQQKLKGFTDEYPGSVSSHDFYFVTRYDSVGLDSTHYVKYDSIHQTKYDSIHDINLSTKIVRLPVQLNYYLPVKKNLAILFTAGTILDLSVTRKTSFRSAYQGQEKVMEYNQRLPAVTFQNLFYGIGLQYSYKKMAIQLAPYYHHQFKTPTYKNALPKWGVNASIKFDLSK